MLQPRTFSGALLVVVAAGVACGPSSSDPGQPDGGLTPGEDGGGEPTGDGGVGGDGSAPAGLGLSFYVDPELPGGDVGGDFDGVLNEATVELEDVRAVGDSAPGDERTSVPHLPLHWGGDGDGADILVFFDTAPPGYYSYVLTDVMSYRMTGTVVVGGVESPFEIVDMPPTPLSISVGLGSFELVAGTNRTVPIRVRLRDAVREQAWDGVPADGDGVRRIDGDSPQIATVREEVLDAFDAEGDSDDVEGDSDDAEVAGGGS